MENDKPSLSARVQLARTLASSVQYLHSTNWVHKALRSHNVVFFNDPYHLDLSNPYLCGFSLARPARHHEMTERPDSNPLYNLYRHPLAHGDAARELIQGFNKVFDIYSLGIILVEIAVWQPIHQVLGVHSLEQGYHVLKPRITKQIRWKLLNEPQYLGMVRGSAGDIFAEVIRTCLEGNFGISFEREEIGDALKLQNMFNSAVLMRLGTISV
jgi:serine/threonine protein kinase